MDSTPWLFTQRPSEYVEDFEGLPDGPFSEFEQSWYSAIWAPQNPRETFRPRASLRGSDIGLNGKALGLVTQLYDGIVYDCIYTMTFHSLWKTVTFDCYVGVHREAPRRWVETLNDRNDILNTVSLLYAGGIQRIVLSNGERSIRALRFNLIPGEYGGAIRIVVDTLKVSA